MYYRVTFSSPFRVRADVYLSADGVCRSGERITGWVGTPAKWAKSMASAQVVIVVEGE